MANRNQAEIQRVIILAKPTRDHPKYFEWQTAHVVFFVRDRQLSRAVATARSELERRRWSFLEFVMRTPLIEGRVLAEGGEVWDAYRHANEHGLFVKVVPRQVFAAKDGPPLLRPARINEPFITGVIEAAGGRRVVADDSTQKSMNADYLLGDFIFELKDLQEDALEKGPHQQKVADLFATYRGSNDAVVVDPSVLTKEDLLKYLDILGSPLQGHVKKAAKQIKATKTLLGQPHLRGGLILLNTGFSSYPHELFAEQVKRYASKDSSQFDAVISISIWMETNSFDSYVLYGFSPQTSDIPEVQALRRAFADGFEQMMTDLMRGKVSPETELAEPRRPIAFSSAGIDFHWQPPTLPLPWEKDA